MAKSNLVTAILVALLLGSVLLSILFCYRFVRIMAQAQTLQFTAQQLQAQLIQIDQKRALFRELANEAVEYSKRNPAILPVLRPFEAGSKSNAAPVRATSR